MKEPTEDQQKLLDALGPAIEKFVRVVNSLPSVCFTGFIYSDEPPLFLQLGNIDADGPQLVAVHYHLAVMAAQIEATGDYKATKISGSPSGSNPEELADKLALGLMGAPTGTLPEHILDDLNRYIQSRRPEKK